MKKNEMSEKDENKIEISDQLYSDTMKELCKIFTQEDEGLVADFIDCLFTPAERRDIVKRWLLVKEIDKGTTQRDIAKKFSMSLCRITRGSKELHKKDSAFRKVLDIVKKNN